MSEKVVHKGKRKQYSADFKRQAIEKLASGNYTLRQLGAELQVSVPTLLKWRMASGAPAATSNPSDESEIARLRAELARITEERNRLRRGIAYLTGIID
jgi:transposase